MKLSIIMQAFAAHTAVAARVPLKETIMLKLAIIVCTLTAPALAAPIRPAVVAVELERAQLGSSVFLPTLPMADTEPGGFVVAAGVDPGWLAFGLQVDDVIQSDNGSPVGERLYIGDGVTILGVLRKGKPVLLHITVHPEPIQTATMDDDDVRRLGTATPPFSTPVHDKHGPSGVRITDTLLALYTKLAVGDIVRTIGGSPIRTDAELATVMQGLPVGPTTIVIERFGRPITLTLTREAPVDLARIKRLGPTRFEIPRAVIDALDKDPWMVTRKVKLVPAGSRGTLHGFKLYEVEPDSLYAAIGLQNEDVILDIDGHSIDTRQETYEARRILRTAAKLTLHIVRRGERIAMTYVIR